MRRIAVLAALPLELKPLVRDWKRLPAPRPVSLWTRTDADGDELIAVCAGMGANAVRRAWAAAEGMGPLDLVLSVGLAGATGDALAVGEVSCVSAIVDAGTGERFQLGKGPRRVLLATVGQTADAAEKARLSATYGAVLVDMEAATVARLASMRSLPVGCIKAVSDEAGAALPEIDRFVDSEGQLQLPRFLLHLLVHPSSWRSVASLANSSARAAEKLAAALKQFLVHKDWDYTCRTGLLVKPDETV